MREKQIITAAVAAIVFAGAVSAHPGGHGEDERPRYTGYDCSAMAGEFDAGKNGVVAVTVFEGKVVFSPKEGTAAVGNCIAPSVAGGKFHPRAQTEFGEAFGKDLGAADCCTVQLKDDALTFDKAATIVWKRRKP
jgi:hypothetical protein